MGKTPLRQVFLLRSISDRSIGNDLPILISLLNLETIAISAKVKLKRLSLERFLEFKAQLLRVFFDEHV